MLLGPDQMWRRHDLRLALARHDLRSVFLIMQRHGISQRQIAAAVGINQSEVSEVLAGKRRIESYTVILRMADGLRLPRGWLGLDHDPETRRLLENPAPPGRRAVMRVAPRLPR